MLIGGARCNEFKAINITLQTLWGINLTCANKICALVGVNPRMALKDIRPERYEVLNKICRDFAPTDGLRKQQDCIKSYINLKHYKGIRHMFGLPCRGQRTRTNASNARNLGFVKKRRSLSM